MPQAKGAATGEGETGCSGATGMKLVVAEWSRKGAKGKAYATSAKCGKVAGREGGRAKGGEWGKGE